MNELIKSDVESVEGEYLTDTEYRMDQVMKRYQEQMEWVGERERNKRQHELEMNLSMALVRLEHSIAFTKALHRFEVEQAKKKQHSKEFDKALMLLFLIIGAAIVKGFFL